MKVAISKGTLKIPPTYFAVAHAERLVTEHTVELFTLVADVKPGQSSTVPVHEIVPALGQSFRRREVVMPMFIPSMARAIRNFAPDVIHQHFGVWSVPAVMASRRARIPLVTTLHGFDVFTMFRKPSSMMSRWHRHNMEAVDRTSTKLLAVSEFLAGSAVGAGMDAAKIEVHYQGIDTDYFTPDRSGATDECPLVVFVGALNAQKGIRDLVAASQALVARVPHRLLVVGDGPLREEIRHMTAATPHVELVGPKDRAGVRELLRKGTVLVVPSKEHNGAREAAGLVALEAQACGTPVVAYASGGLAEMVHAGESGLLVPEGDISALTGSIGEVLGLQTADYRSMRSSARQFVVAERSLTRSCEELIQHYAGINS